MICESFLSEKIEKVQPSFLITNKTTKMPSIYTKMRENSPDKYPSRMGEIWTTGEHSIMLSFLKEYNLPISEVARILRRTHGAISSRMRLVVLEYIFTKNYTINQIVSKFNFEYGFVVRAIKTKERFYKNTLGAPYKACSEFAVKMDVLEAELKTKTKN